ncbi:MAG TPA: DUF5615 family PIN-like protein [Candidatus Wunengus sp. YC60]|uniref:DUF5615 family PIN-like protein n=1 Tax=Candidatus Wunengus sp. YC60 TaxID=3367697 RepID=UPI004025165E
MARLRVYTDENVDVQVAEGLRRRGIEAFSAIEKGMIGAADREHFTYAFKIQAVIFTHDHHFIEIAKELTNGGKTHFNPPLPPPKMGIDLLLAILRRWTGLFHPLMVSVRLSAHVAGLSNHHAKD